MSCNTCVYLCFYDVMCAAVIKFTEESLQKLHLKSSGAKRVMRQKNRGFVGVCKQCTSPMLCQNIFTQNEL